MESDAEAHSQHQAELEKSCEKVEDRSKQARGIKDTTRISIESTNWAPWVLTEPEPSTMQDLDLDCLHIYGKCVTRSSFSNKCIKGYLAFCFLLLNSFPLNWIAWLGFSCR